jgi:AcrR family transcriptional regulator
MAHTTAHKQRWQRRKAARPGEILDAALELFTEKGFVATRLDEIADRAGVSKGTLYLYFDSKEDMFRAMVQNIIVPHVDQAEQLISDHVGTQRELIECFVWNWWEVVGKTRLAAIPKLLVAEAHHFPELAEFYVIHVVDRVRNLLAAIIRQGVAQGEFKKVDANSAVRVLIAPLVFAVIWDRSLGLFDKSDYDRGQYIRTHLQLFFEGVSHR